MTSLVAIIGLQPSPRFFVLFRYCISFESRNGGTTFYP
jgi:hypothetical protein